MMPKGGTGVVSVQGLGKARGSILREKSILITQLNYLLVAKHATFLFSKRQRITLRLLYAMSRPSVCLSVVCLSVVCLLSVTLVHPTQAVELFGNFFTIR